MSDGSAQSSAPASSAGTASFDRTAGAQRWGEGGPEREKSRSLKPLMRLMPYMKRQQTTAVLAIIFLFVAAALNLAITFPVQWLGNNAFQSFDPAMINTGFLAMIGIALFLGVTSAIRFYYFSRFGERLAADLRGDVYARLMSLSPAYFSKLKTGEAVSRLTADVTLILFVMAPVLILPILAMGRRVRKLSVNAQDRIADAASEATETIDAIDLVQAYGMEKEREGRFRSAIELAFDAALARIGARAWLTGIVIALMFAGVTGVVWIGALEVQSGAMSVGSFMQFVLLAMFGVGGFATVAEVMGDAMRASGAAQRAVEILDQRPDIAAPPSPRPMPAKIAGHVRLENVSFAYPDAAGPSLKDVSFEARPGELVALVGPSGAGKSTVFRMLLRFFDPQTGEVSLDDMDARDADPGEWRARFAYVPQEAPIFSGDAAGNVRFGRTDASEDEVRDALKKAEAFAFLEGRGGLAAEVGAKGRQLSGGERQRIAIARALVRGAPVMLLDEATSALDAANERLVQKALDQASEGRTTLVIAHRLATVRKANRIVVFEQGRVVEQGDHETLVKAGGLYAKLAEMQFTSG